jgi:hypothetical protein
MQLFARFLKKCGFAALAWGKDGKVPAQVNHGLKILLFGVGHILQGNVIGLFRIYNS